MSIAKIITQEEELELYAISSLANQPKKNISWMTPQYTKPIRRENGNPVSI